MHSASVCVMRRVASRVGSAVGPGRGAPSVRPLSAIAGGVGDLPKCAQKGPYKVTLKAGKMVPWCSCGLSNKQPRCDGSHRKHETGMEPLRYKPEEDVEEAWFCGCKRTATPPFCDGTHNTL